MCTTHNWRMSVRPNVLSTQMMRQLVFLIFNIFSCTEQLELLDFNANSKNYVSGRVFLQSHRLATSHYSYFSIKLPA